jgi:hypothetical protein
MVRDELVADAADVREALHKLCLKAWPELVVSPVDVDRPGVEDVGHVLREMVAPSCLIVLDQIAAHQADLLPSKAVLVQMHAKLAVEIFVLVEFDLCAVGFVSDRNPAKLRRTVIVDEAGEDVGKSLHVPVGMILAAPRPRDVDCRGCRLRELHRPFE